MNGYHEARIVERQLEHIYKENPITPDSIREWMNLLRTVKTSISVYEEICSKHIERVAR